MKSSISRLVLIPTVLSSALFLAGAPVAQTTANANGVSPDACRPLGFELQRGYGYGAIVPVQAKPSSSGSVGGSPNESVYVTGTSIRGQAPVGANVITVDRAAMEASGAQTTQQLLSTIPGSPPPPPAPPPPPLSAAVASGNQTVTVSGTSIRGQAPAGVGRIAQDTEKYPNATPNPVKQVAQEPVSTFSIDVDTASYSNTRRFLVDGNLPPRDAVRVEEMVNYFDYGYQKPAKASEPFAMYTSLVPSPWSKNKRILHIGLQGYDIPRTQQPSLNLVFLMDTSGSMMPEDRLPLAKKSLNVLIDQLRPQDRVSLVAYAGSAGAVLGPTSGDQKLKIRCALAVLESGGSTAGGAGMALAYSLAEQNFKKDAVNRIIMMTDGDFNTGVYSAGKLTDFVAEKRKTGIYLSVYGFGRGNYNDLMMQTLAQNGNGTASYVASLDEARKLFRDDLGGSLFPIANDVKIQVEFNPAKVSEYRLIGYETRLLNREDFNNDQVDAGEVGSNASVTALYEVTMVGAPGSSDPLRYGARPAITADKDGELAYLKIRYKLPGQDTSKLMQRPISAVNTASDAASAPEASRWAMAVAAFGEKLRGSSWIDADYSWDRIENLAQRSRGDDPFGLRAEFVRLVRDAKSASSVNNPM